MESSVHKFLKEYIRNLKQGVENDEFCTNILGKRSIRESFSPTKEEEGINKDKELENHNLSKTEGGRRRKRLRLAKSCDKKKKLPIKNIAKTIITGKKVHLFQLYGRRNRWRPRTCSLVGVHASTSTDDVFPEAYSSTESTLCWNSKQTVPASIQGNELNSPFTTPKLSLSKPPKSEPRKTPYVTNRFSQLRMFHSFRQARLINVRHFQSDVSGIGNIICIKKISP